MSALAASFFVCFALRLASRHPLGSHSTGSHDCTTTTPPHDHYALDHAIFTTAAAHPKKQPCNLPPTTIHYPTEAGSPPPPVDHAVHIRRTPPGPSSSHCRRISFVCEWNGTEWNDTTSRFERGAFVANRGVEAVWQAGGR